MIDTPVQLFEWFEEPAAPAGSPSPPLLRVSKLALVTTEPSIAASSESVQPAADDFFDIVGTEAPGQPADHIRPKTWEEVREIVAKIKACGSKVALP